MTRTSVYLGLMLWGFIMFVVPTEILYDILVVLGALGLLGLCAVLIGYIINRCFDG